jgi:hypothetical protein
MNIPKKQRYYTTTQKSKQHSLYFGSHSKKKGGEISRGILGSHDSEYENGCLLGCSAV